MCTLRIRGIFTTALTNLFCKYDFKIVQPSRAVCQRFQLKPNQDPYDLDLYDLEDRQGVFTCGNPQGIERVIGILEQELPDVIVRRFKLGLYAVYRGLARCENSEGTLIDLGGAVGLLPQEQFDPGEAITVQVAQLPDRGKEPVLRRMIGIPGRYAVLISTGRIAASRKIADHGERMRLSWLGAELAPQGWGIVWHTAAAGKPRSAIAEDLEGLAARAKQLKERTASEPPALLLEGEQAVHIEFPGGAKRRLDELRGEVIPTASGHHKAKASGREADIDTFNLPKRNAELLVEHVKLDGRVEVLGQGTVTSVDPGEGVVELEREIKTKGTYDGLGVTKEPGDRAVTTFCEDRWWYKTSYYSPLGELKGEYYNINTPLEIYPDRIRYVDLEIDLARLAQEELRIIDEAKLEEAIRAGLVNKELAQRAREVAQAILRESGGDDLREGALSE